MKRNYFGVLNNKLINYQILNQNSEYQRYKEDAEINKTPFYYWYHFCSETSEDKRQLIIYGD